MQNSNLKQQKFTGAEKRQQALRTNPYEILDKINSFNTHKLQNQNPRLGFKKPGLTPMGYSQRAIFDKVENGSYRSGQKTAANSRPSEAEYF